MLKRRNRQMCQGRHETSEDLSDNEIGTDGLDKLFQAGPVTAKFQTTSCTRKRIGLHWQLQVLRDHRVPCVVLKAYRNSVDEALLQSTMSCCVSNFGNQLCQSITNHDESFQERSGPLISDLRIFMAYLKVMHGYAFLSFFWIVHDLQSTLRIPLWTLWWSISTRSLRHTLILTVCRPTAATACPIICIW